MRTRHPDVIAMALFMRDNEIDLSAFRARFPREHSEDAEILQVWRAIRA